MTKFVPSPAGFSQLGRSKMVLNLLFRTATQAALAAKALAPKRSGDYARSITADAGINEHGEAVGRVKATDFKANWIETGTVKQPAHAPITRGVEAVTGKTPRDVGGA